MFEVGVSSQVVLVSTCFCQLKRGFRFSGGLTANPMFSLMRFKERIVGSHDIRSPIGGCLV